MYHLLISGSFDPSPALAQESTLDLFEDAVQDPFPLADDSEHMDLLAEAMLDPIKTTGINLADYRGFQIHMLYES